MNEPQGGITVVVPALDPAGSQCGDLKQTVDSIEVALVGTRHEIVIVTTSDSLSQPLPQWVTQHCRLLEESASGHSQALNTGCEAAQENHILVLNPGDQLLSSPALKHRLSELDSGTIYCFRVISDKGFIGGIYPTSTAIPIRSYIQKHGLKIFTMLPHQGLLIPKNLFNAKTCYEGFYKLRMDFAFLMLLSKQNSENLLSAEALPAAYYLPGGISQKRSNFPLFFTEELKITWRYYRRIWPTTVAKLLFSKIDSALIHRPK